MNRIIYQNILEKFARRMRKVVISRATFIWRKSGPESWIFSELRVNLVVECFENGVKKLHQLGVNLQSSVTFWSFYCCFHFRFSLHNSQMLFSSFTTLRISMSLEIPNMYCHIWTIIFNNDFKNYILFKKVP